MTLYERVNESPAGAAIGQGSEFPLNPFRTAELLGFDRVCANTRDAIFHLDYMLEAASNVAIICNTIGRLADDLQNWSMAEVAMVELDDSFCSTSSIMPQKKNPKALEYIRGISGLSIGHLTSVFALMKTTSDVIEPHSMVPWELWEGIDECISALNIMRGVLETLAVKSDIMGRRVKEFWTQASDLAGIIVRENNLSWRTAHQIVGILVRKTIEQGLKPLDITSEILDQAAVEYIGRPLRISENIIKQALDPEESVKAKKVVGGPSPDQVQGQIEELRRHIQEQRSILQKVKDRIKLANSKLEEAITNIIFGLS
jgi:argininosuccinate lyase